MNPDGTGFEYFAHGVRNSVGFDWHPGDQGAVLRDPRARLARATTCRATGFDVAPKKGLHFGFPYCHQGDILDPEFGKGRSCGEFAAPLLKTGPHVAGNGVEFYTGSMFPAEYKNRIFLAQRGSWNRTQEDRLPRDDGHARAPATCPSTRSFAEGWLAGRRDLGPAGLHAGR